MNMFFLIMTMFSGVVAGYFLRRWKPLAHIGRAISVTILLMLFILGMEIGSDDQVLGNLSVLGLQALLLAFAGAMGSVVFASVLYRIIVRKDRNSD